MLNCSWAADSLTAAPLCSHSLLPQCGLTHCCPTVVFQWSTRKFAPNLWPTIGKIAHNIGWTTLGTMQWTAWEIAFIRMYATGKIPFVSDAEAFSTVGGVLHTLAWVSAIPVTQTTD